MSNVITSLVQKVKRSCDNDTLMFCFSGDTVAQAYDREMIYKKWVTPEDSYTYTPITEEDENGHKIIKMVPTNNNAGKYEATEKSYKPGLDEYCYWNRIILPRMVSQPCVNIFYKNTNGVWVDYRKCLTVYPQLSILVSSIRYEDKVKVDVNILPKCTFTDADKYVHYIDEHDGQDNDLSLPSLEVDTNDPEQVTFRPFSINNPQLPKSASHVMQDLRVSVPQGFKAEDFLVWLNGAFVPSIQDNTYENVMYLANAMTMIDTHVINQVSGALAHPKGANATVVLDEDNDEYRWDVRLHFFGWKNVKVSKWYKPQSTEKTPIIHNYSSVYIVKTITFPVEINENAHFIMYNGVVLSPEEYTIDPHDKRKITLNNVERDAYMLLNSILNDIAYDMKNGTSYYANVKPLKLIQDALTERTYSLVNFSSTEDGKTLYMKRSCACATNFPYFREVTFPEINCGDLVLINGTFNRYEWIHDNTIFFPKFKYTYTAEEANIKETKIQRIYFVLE